MMTKRTFLSRRTRFLDNKAFMHLIYKNHWPIFLQRGNNTYWKKNYTGSKRGGEQVYDKEGTIGLLSLYTNVQVRVSIYLQIHLIKSSHDAKNTVGTYHTKKNIFLIADLQNPKSWTVFFYLYRNCLKH